MQTSLASRFSFKLPRLAQALDAYELEDIKPADMPMLMLIPFAFAIGVVNLIWLLATGAAQIYVLAAAIGPALIAAIWLPATADLRHRARCAWGKNAKMMMIISAIVSSSVLTAILAVDGITSLERFSIIPGHNRTS